MVLFLWLLKPVALGKLYFLVNTLALPADEIDPSIVIPAQLLFGVSGYRCLFSNRYEDNVVFHDSPLSSALVTCVLATCAEVAWIFQFSHDRDPSQNDRGVAPCLAPSGGPARSSVTRGRDD